MESVLLDSKEEVRCSRSRGRPQEFFSDPTADSIIAEANAPLEPLTETNLAVLSRIDDRIMKRLPVVCGSRSDDSAPKLFSRRVQVASKGRHAPRPLDEASTALSRTASSTWLKDGATAERLELALGPNARATGARSKHAAGEAVEEKGRVCPATASKSVI